MSEADDRLRALDKISEDRPLTFYDAMEYRFWTSIRKMADKNGVVQQPVWIWPRPKLHLDDTTGETIQ
jgi:hypothetical protein